MKETTTLLVCRACCCGTVDKHPGTDHGAQLDALLDVAHHTPGLAVRVVDCLDECDRSNVVVVRRTGLPRKERDLWLGGVLTPAATDALCAWARDGAAGATPQPLQQRTFRHVPPRR